MFAHLFSYKLKCFLRDRTMLFWTMVYPLLMATLFQLAFANLNAINTFTSIPIAVVDNAAYQDNFGLRTALQAAAESKPGQDPLLKVQEVALTEADRMLEKGSIDGYLVLEPGIRLVVKRSGINQTILKSFFDQYVQIESAIATILEENPAVLQQNILNVLSKPEAYLHEVPIAKAQPDPRAILFYALLAMTSLFGAFFGIRIINEVQADQSYCGARLNVAPVHKLRLLGCALAAALVIQFAELVVLVGYMRYVLNVSFGSQLTYILLTCLVGSIVGLSMGMFIGSALKTGEGVKIGVVIGVTLTMSTFSGLYNANLKYIVAKAVPFLAWVNPAALVTDALYALYYYDTHQRFFFNISVLLAFSLFFFVGAYLVLRRSQYASLPSIFQDN